MSTDNASRAACVSIARRLQSDHRARRRFEPVARPNGVRGICAAYAIQRELVNLRRQTTGAAVAGYKIGLTTKQMQAMCGIDCPVSGVILSDSIFETPAYLDADSYGRLGLEFEVAVRMSKDLRRTNKEFTLTEIERSVDAVCAAIELVDDRGCDYGSLDAFSLVADNSWNAGIVCGTWKREWPALKTLEGIVRADGSEVGRGFGHDVLGGPLIALSWFANRAREGETVLRAGEIVTTGNLIRTQFPTAASRYQFDIKGLGSVTCEVMF